MSELNTGTKPSNNDPRKQIVYLRGELNKRIIAVQEAHEERDRLRAALIKIQEITNTVHNHERMTHKIINEVLNDE